MIILYDLLIYRWGEGKVKISTENSFFFLIVKLFGVNFFIKKQAIRSKLIKFGITFSNENFLEIIFFFGKIIRSKPFQSKNYSEWRFSK